MSIYCVWAQPVENTITPENIDEYGSIHDIAAEYADEEDGATTSKQFCDGQTSKTPPRYAQDRMIGIYTRSPEAAQLVSDWLRGDVVQRVAAGQLQIPLMANWEPRFVVSALDAGLNLSRLQNRVYHEIPLVATDLLDVMLEEILQAGIDISDVKAIIRQVKQRAGSRLL